MRERAGEIDRVGAGAVVIGRSSPRQARGLRDDEGVPFPLLCDPEGATFDAFGLSPRPGVLLRPEGWVRWIGANLRGARQRRITGNVLQPPGDAVVDAEGRVRFVHRGRSLGDHAPVARLLEEAAALARRA